MHTTDRRGFLGMLAGLSLPAWFPRLAFASRSPTRHRQRDVVVCVFLRGGVDGVSAVVPYVEDDLYRARPTLAIPPPGAGSASVLDLDGSFGLHPALAPLHELFQDDALAIVHAVGLPNETRSHFDAMDFMERGTPGQKILDTGWIARHLATSTRPEDTPFRAISLGPTVPASLRGPVPVTSLQSIADFHLSGDSTQVEEFQRLISTLYAGNGLLGDSADRTFSAIARLAAADPLRYRPQNGASYPGSDFGLGLRQVAQMIRAQVGLEIACLDIGGWDTHQDQGAATGRLAELLSGLAAGLHAFAVDLDRTMDHVTVLVMTEFGRRIAENASAGTDHGRATFMLALGGGVEGGRVYGDWPTLAPPALVGPGDLAVTTDFRTVLWELLDRRVGNDQLAAVFPGFAPPEPIGLFRSQPAEPRRPVVARG